MRFSVIVPRVSSAMYAEVEGSNNLVKPNQDCQYNIVRVLRDSLLRAMMRKL